MPPSGATASRSAYIQTFVGDHKSEDERDQRDDDRPLEPKENSEDDQTDAGREAVGVIHDAAFYLGDAVADEFQHAEDDDAYSQNGADNIFYLPRPKHERETEQDIHKRSNEFHHTGFFHNIVSFLQIDLCKQRVPLSTEGTDTGSSESLLRAPFRFRARFVAHPEKPRAFGACSAAPSQPARGLRIADCRSLRTLGTVF